MTHTVPRLNCTMTLVLIRHQKPTWDFKKLHSRYGLFLATNLGQTQDSNTDNPLSIF